MPVYRDQRMLRRDLLLREHWNMILMPNVITMVIITVRGMSVDITMAMKAAAVITESRSL